MLADMEKQQEQRIYSFPQDETRPAPTPQPAVVERDWFAIVMRSFGLVLLAFGFLVGLNVMLEARQLYSNPVHIEQLAAAIEEGSNLDSTLSSANENEDGKSSGVQLSYFMAWIFALVLLVMTSMIAFAAMRTGGELVLQDKKSKQLIKLLTNEVSNYKKQKK